MNLFKYVISYRKIFNDFIVPNLQNILLFIIISISERTAIEQVRKAGTTDYAWKTEWYHQQVITTDTQ